MGRTGRMWVVCTYCHTVRIPREEAMLAYGASEQNVELDWMGDWIDTPQTVAATTRAPAVLKNVLQIGFKQYV